MIYFPGNVRALRLAKKWSQEKLATLLNVKSNTISNYETGTSTPDFNLLVSIIKIFEIDANDIIFKDLSQGSVSTQDASKTANTDRNAEKNIYETRLLEKDKTIAALEETVALQKDIIRSFRSTQATA